jgi:hypothetical protein
MLNSELAGTRPRRRRKHSIVLPKGSGGRKHLTRVKTDVVNVWYEQRRRTSLCSGMIKGPSLIGAVLLLARCNLVAAPLEVVPDEAPQSIFGGLPQRVRVILHNPDSRTVETSASLRIFQTSSSTAAWLSEFPWKRLEVLAGQTIIESAGLSLPAVKSETPFLIQWVDESHRIIGRTEILVYPTNLLSALRPLAGGKPLGLFDPDNRLGPLLNSAGVEFEDLGARELSSFPGSLAILGPFQSAAQMKTGFQERVKKLAGKGATVVWLQPPAPRKSGLRAPFYSVRVGSGTVMIVDAQLCSGLADNPVAQLNLIRLTELAIRPQCPGLPQSFIQPE